MTIAVLIFALALGVVLTGLLQVRSIAGPLSRMVLATGEISRGDYAQRISPGGIQELDELSSSINHLAGELEIRLAELTRQALSDPLTGLPNRALYRDRLQHALARATETRRRSRPCSSTSTTSRS
jgi:HAMP domain-containing protein